MTALVSLLFITMMVKLHIFPYTCLFTFFGNNYNIDELKLKHHTKRKNDHKHFFTSATPIN